MTSGKYISFRFAQPVKRLGLTLVEVVISTILVSFLMVTALRTTANVFQTWTVTAEQSEGQFLAQQLMSEILQQSYQDPEDPGSTLGVNTGETSGDRSTFDDVDDYKDYTASPPKDRTNTVLSEYTGWTETVYIKKVSNGNPTFEVNDNFNEQRLKKITVTVTSPAGKTTTLIALRSMDGAMEQARSVDQTPVSWIGVEFQASGQTLQTGIQLQNHSTD